MVMAMADLKDGLFCHLDRTIQRLCEGSDDRFIHTAEAPPSNVGYLSTVEYLVKRLRRECEDIFVDNALMCCHIWFCLAGFSIPLPSHEACSCDFSERTNSRTISVCDRPVTSAYSLKISISLSGKRQFNTLSDLSRFILTCSDTCTTMIIAHAIKMVRHLL